MNFDSLLKRLIDDILLLHSIQFVRHPNINLPHKGNGSVGIVHKH